MPNGTVSRFAYDGAAGWLTTRTDAKGQIAHYGYFKDGSLQSISYENAEHPTASVSFTYDQKFARVSSSLDGIGTTAYQYNPFNGLLGSGRLQSVDGPLPDDTSVVTYDELGRVKTQQLDSAATSIDYDILGRTVGSTTPLGTFAMDYIGSSGRMRQLTYPMGQKTMLSYQNHIGDDRLESISHQQANGTAMGSHVYAYSASGNITRWTQQSGNFQLDQLFGYDANDQLTSVTSNGSGSLRIAFDLAGVPIAQFPDFI